MKRIGPLFLVAIFGIALVGCSDSQAMSTTTRSVLQQEVRSVELAANQRHPAIAHAALVKLRNDVDKYESLNELDQTAGKNILNSVSAVQADLVLITTTTTTTTTTNTTTTTTIPAPVPPGPHGPKHAHNPKPGKVNGNNQD